MATAPDSTCVLILGMHRSGTSLVAGALNILGLSLGDPANMMPPNEGNPTGYWEHLRLVDVNDRILDSMARAWPTSVPLPPDWIVTPVGERATASLRQALSAEIGAEPRWGFKDPRATLLIPAYRKALDQLHIRPKVLLGLRNPLDVARSLQRRDDIPLEKGIAMWANYTLSALADSVGLDMLVFSYDELLEGRESALEPIARFCGLDWSPMPEQSYDLRRLFRPDLRHSRSQESDIKGAHEIWEVAKRTYELAIEVAQDPSFSLRESFRSEIARLLNELRSQSQPFAETRLAKCRVYWATEDGGERCEEVQFVIPDTGKHISVMIPRLPSDRLRLDACNQPAVVFFSRPQLIGIRNGDALIAKVWENSEGVCQGGSALILDYEGGVAATCLSDNSQIYLPLDDVSRAFDSYRFDCDVQGFALPWDGSKLLDEKSDTVRRRLAELDSLRDERETLLQRVQAVQNSRLWRMTRGLARLFGR